MTTDHAHPEHTHPEHAHPEHAHPEAKGRAPAAAEKPLAEVAAVLEVVCRSVTELARSAPKPPSRIRMQDGQTRVEVEWHDPLRAGAVHVAATGVAVPGPEPVEPAAEPANPHTYLRSPMVGTFYHAGSPDSPPFVRVGDVVRQGQQVGVLEAMKMMSSVTADAGGRVVEVLAGNAQRVEFDEPLIALEPVAADEGG